VRRADYRPPVWLDQPTAHGDWRELTVAAPALGGEVWVRIWSPEGAGERVLLAHDGPEFDKLADLGIYAGANVGSGVLPPFHLVLLAPGDRHDWYSANPNYASTLAGPVLERLRAELRFLGPVIGMGASLGGLAMLHAQRRHPGTFGALFLQSGSFFTPRFDSQESRFPRYQRIVRFVRATLREGVHADPVPVVLTCGSAEENVHNNRLMARTLSAQGYPASLHEVPDLHNYTAWRDAFEPHLTGLLARTW
jgi:enterochelin esterase-like enzyme